MSRASYLWLLIGTVFVVTLYLAYVFILFLRIQVISLESLSQEVIMSAQPLPVLPTSSLGQSILFVGDILMSRKVEYYMKSKGSKYPFQNVEKLFRNHTAVVVNFEASVPSVHVPTPFFNTQFSVDRTLLPVLAQVGVTHAALANNHTQDFGRTGYNNTMVALSDSQLAPFGDPEGISSSSVTVVTLGEYKIGIIAINAVFSKPDLYKLRQQLQTLSLESDLQIAYIHWGTEYQLYHSPDQANYAELLSTLGIDAIIGHHPHVTQDIQLVADIPVFYSLGNFVFDQYFSKEVQEGYALGFSVEQQSLVFTINPVSSLANQSQPSEMNETDKQGYLDALAKRSHPDLSSNIKQGKIIIPLRLATSSKSRIISP